MDIVADLQIHSRFARACSKNTTIPLLEKWAQVKGVDVLGTGDFQHPEWNKEIKEILEEDDKGILRTKNGFPFIWQTEVSLMYSQDGKGRRVHNLIFAPNGGVADQITEALGKRGRLDYDGRPIFGFSCIELVDMMRSISDKIEIIPAHCLLPDEKIICNPKIKKISEIKEGDKVFTHTGSYQKVIKTHQRAYRGLAYKIQPYYFTRGINVTSEHPFLAIKPIKCSYVGGLCKPNSITKGKHKCKKEHYNDYKPKWVLAQNLETNDVLLYPRQKKTVDKKEIKISNIIGKDGYKINKYIIPKTGRQDKKIKNTVKVSQNFCRLVGYYLAEGYTNRKNNHISFSFGSKETNYIEDVTSLMKECFNVELTEIRKRHGFELYFYSKALVDFFESLFYIEGENKKANVKVLPLWMTLLPEKKQAEIFRGWWRGDAGVTVSEVMAEQMKIICLRLGIIPSIYIQSKDKQNTYGSKIDGRLIKANFDSFIFNNLSFYGDGFGLIKDAVFKKFDTKIKRRHGWLDENYAYIPIKEITKSDYIGMVYNLEVENDNSYVTVAATVHNCMTPWFGLLGSKSGFDSLEHCFGDRSKYIHAVETGLSADPPMMWRMKFLDNKQLVSFSDAHSYWPWRLGREATVFDVKELSYDNILHAIRTGEGLKETFEFFPEEGKYHWDGHRNCGITLSPKETEKLGGKCPKCGNNLTIGVEYRIEQLAEREHGEKPSNAKGFKSLIPLSEIIQFHLGLNMVSSNKVWDIYNTLIKTFKNELNILLNVSKEDLEKTVDPKLAEKIVKVRNKEVHIFPGSDGEYGKLLFDKKEYDALVGNVEEKKKTKAQKNLLDF